MCGLISKLLLRDFIDFTMNYDAVCMCETRCDDDDDDDTNNKRKKMINSGFDIVYKNRSALRR